jgi:hypothetical protein
LVSVATAQPVEARNMKRNPNKNVVISVYNEITTIKSSFVMADHPSSNQKGPLPNPTFSSLFLLEFGFSYHYTTQLRLDTCRETLAKML